MANQFCTFSKLLLNSSNRTTSFICQNLFRRNLRCSSSAIEESTTYSTNGLNSSSDNHFESPENSRLLRVSIIGVPNAGKSTLINRLTLYDVCPVSKRAHTTRTLQKASFVEDDTQVVFIDTPGLVNIKDIKKFSFSNEFIYGPENAIRQADLIAILHDISYPGPRHVLDTRIVSILRKHPEKNSILILNKVDVLKSKRKLLDSVRYLTCGIVGGQVIPVASAKRTEKKIDKSEIFEKTREKLYPTENSEKDGTKGPTRLHPYFTEEEISEGLHEVGWPSFHDVFMISALEGDGVELLRNYMVMNAERSPWQMSPDILTDCSPTDLTLRIVKSKLLQYLPQEMPYVINPKLEFWEEVNESRLKIVVILECPNERIAKRVVGQGGNNVTFIKTETEKALAQITRKEIDLYISVVDKSPKQSSKQ